MIQEFGAEYAYDNHFEPHEPAEGDYVLHYSPAGCLARVTHVGRADADAGDSGEVMELPRLADYPRRPGSVTYLFCLGEERFFLALDERVLGARGLCLRVRQLAQARRAAAPSLCGGDGLPARPLVPGKPLLRALRGRRWSSPREAARSCAPSARASCTPRSAPASSAP